MPTAPAFNMPSKDRMIEVFKADLSDAKIPYVDETGRYADFHALRHTCGSWLAASGAHPKVIQRVMRHSTITPTMDRYTHLFKGDEAQAVAKLPSLSAPGQDRSQATGTYDENTSDDLRGAIRGAMDGKQWTDKPGRMDSRKNQADPRRKTTHRVTDDPTDNRRAPTHAVERSRTSTGCLAPLGPEPSASANFATTALVL